MGCQWVSLYAGGMKSMLTAMGRRRIIAANVGRCGMAEAACATGV